MEMNRKEPVLEASALQPDVPDELKQEPQARKTVSGVEIPPKRDIDFVRLRDEVEEALMETVIEQQKPDTTAPEAAKEEPKQEQVNNREERAKLPNEMTDAERALHYETAYFISENLRQKEAKRHAAERNEFVRKPGSMRWIESACHVAARNGFGYIIHQPVCMPDASESETSKSRKHNHDTLWAVLAGFAACLALMVVGGLMVIAVLSYARW